MTPPLYKESNKILLISHRGNIDGRSPKLENTPSHLNNALNLGYDVELDVWDIDGKYYLGHDTPKVETTLEYLDNSKFWCHCKNIKALYSLVKKGIHCFFHQNDDVTLTSRGILWIYPKKQLFEGSVCVMPEWGYTGDISACAAICSDNIKDYKK
jgi:hypothetical protein